MMKLVLGAVAALFLVAAAPAVACDDCKNCPNHKKEAAAETKAPAVADAEKNCGCHKGGDSKECKCGEGCKCANCPVHTKKGEKKDEPKKG